MAFGPNVGQPVEVSVGHQKKTFLLTQIMSEYRLSFHNYERSNEIIFFIPKPTSPAELGLSGDTRKLGIGFEKLSIEKKS
jgi:phosphoglycerol transferase